MTCEVSRCPRRGNVLVWFRFSKEPHAYCSWHAYRNGKLRWRLQDVTKVVDADASTRKSGRG